MPPSRLRRRANLVLLTLFAIAILILGGLVVYLGPDLWVILNAWMQQGSIKA